MIFNSATNLTVFLFSLIVLAVLFLAIRSVKSIPGHKIWLGLYTALVLAISIGAITGLTMKFVIPIAPIFVVLNIAIAIAIAFSSFGKEVATSLSFTALLGLQAFRFPLELILHEWSNQGVIPETMTWSGQNWDILAGITCLVAVPFYKKSIKLVWAVQLVSFGLLINVIRVAMMSSPFPFSWEMERPLLLLFNFPYALILPCLVTMALTCHLLVFRKLIFK